MQTQSSPTPNTNSTPPSFADKTILRSFYRDLIKATGGRWQSSTEYYFRAYWPKELNVTFPLIWTGAEFYNACEITFGPGSSMERTIELLGIIRTEALKILEKDYKDVLEFDTVKFLFTK